jgi:excisionase family DNA binding protein
MNVLTTGQAASLFGVDVATIRRRIRAGILRARKSPGGRYLVALSDEGAYLAYLNGLLTEVRKQRNALERQVEAQRWDLERSAQERAELEELVISLRRPNLGKGSHGAVRAESGAVTGPEPCEPGGAAVARLSVLRSRGDKKDLGASLVLTGVVALAAGLLLHLALRTHAIDSAVHLGYLVGLVGLLLLLIGLLIVY